MNGFPVRRRLIVLLTLLVFAALLATALLFSGQDLSLPGQGAQLLDVYRATESRSLTVARIVQSSQPEIMNQRLAQPLPLSLRSATRPSPGLYAGAVIQPLAADDPIGSPQAVWCITLEDEQGHEELLLLGQYERVGQTDWLLYRPLAADVRQQLGCSGDSAFN